MPRSSLLVLLLAGCVGAAPHVATDAASSTTGLSDATVEVSSPDSATSRADAAAPDGESSAGFDAGAGRDADGDAPGLVVDDLCPDAEKYDNECSMSCAGAPGCLKSPGHRCRSDECCYRKDGWEACLPL